MLRVTTTESGMVQGRMGVDARITVFKGIPYAADTSGENRWRAPQPAPKWEGVRKCFEFGPITMQTIPGADPNAFYSKEWNVDPDIPMGEDSLCLNIWTPAKKADEKLPVMVWIFGGGLQTGYAHEMEFDGERIASRGVILVSVAYRLNVFGFLAHPDLTRDQPDAPTNFGFLDQMAGIQWVKRNIANFGGDPENITIFGQSSGGVSVFEHLCSPMTEGLFQHAIIQSSAGGSIKAPYPKTGFRMEQTMEEAEAAGVKFLREQLGVETIEEARKLPAEFIRDKCVESHGWFPQTIEGKFSTETVFECTFGGRTHDVPVIIGYTEDEMKIGKPAGIDEEVEAYVRENYGPYADEYLAVCRELAEKEGKTLAQTTICNPNENMTRIVGDILSSQGKKVYTYAFDPEIPGDDAGAFHSSDLWFCFETLMKCWRPFDGHHYDLARKMCNYWTNFAKNGDPNGKDADGTDMPTWTPHNAETPYVMRFYDEVGMEPAGENKKREVLVRSNIETMKKSLEA